MALTPGADFTAAPSLLAGNTMGDAAGLSVVQNPDSPVVTMAQPYSAPVAPTPVVDTRSGTQKLLAGVLSGLAGGIAAPTDSTQGGVLGLQQQQRQEAQVQQQIAQQNQNQQAQFQDQVQQAQTQRANAAQTNSDALQVAQLHTANLNALEAAHRVAFLPVSDQRAYAQNQADIFDAYKKAGRTPYMMADSTEAINDFIKQNPAAATWEVVHLHNPGSGEGEVAFIPPTQPGQKPLSAQAKFNALKAVGAPISSEEAAGMSDSDFYKANQAFTLEKMRQDGENHRNAVTQASENQRNQQRINASNPQTPSNPSGSNAPSPDDTLADAVESGRQFLGDLSGRGDKGQKPRVTQILAKRGVNTADLIQEEKFAKDKGTQQAVVSANTLLGVNGNKGALDQYSDALKAANVSSWKQLNALINSGNIDAGTQQGRAIQKARELGVAAQEQYAKVLVGGGQTTNKALDKAAELFNANFGANTASGAVDGARIELQDRLDAMGARSRYIKNGIEKDQTPTPEIAAKVPEGSGYQAANGSLWVKTNGKLVRFKPQGK